MFSDLLPVLLETEAKEEREGLGLVTKTHTQASKRRFRLDCHGCDSLDQTVAERVATVAEGHIQLSDGKLRVPAGLLDDAGHDADDDSVEQGNYADDSARVLIRFQ